MGGAWGDAFRAELRRQLEALGVELLLGSALREPPATSVGTLQPLTVVTESGTELAADIWFRCFGVDPVSDYLAGELAAARQESGHIAVTEALRLPGQERVFAIGDVTATRAPKMAAAANVQAEIVAANVRALIEGRDDLTAYEPDEPGIVLPLGPTGGASHIPQMGGLVDAEMTTQMKSSHLFVGHYAGILNLGEPAPAAAAEA